MTGLERAVARLQRDPRVLAIWLFGSTASGTRRETSDIDLAVLATEPFELGDELRLRALVVEELHHEDVDLILMGDAPPLLQHEILATGRRLFARDPERVDQFEERAILRYLDTEYLRRLRHELLREATR